MKTFLITIIGLVFGRLTLSGQQDLSGKVVDKEKLEALIGVQVFIPGTPEGTVTDQDGRFFLHTNSNFPITLSFAFLSYDTLSITIADDKDITIQWDRSLSLSDIVVEDNIAREKKKNSFQQVEVLTPQELEQNPGTNPNDALIMKANIDGITSSIGMKTINTKGFNSAAPIRMLQIIDGVDNQSPGLNFSLGNFLATSELDLLSIAVIAGASGPYYGPNAFNGVISMKTKDPFTHQGLTVMTRVGERNLVEVGLRYADGFKNRQGLEFAAYKINLYAFSAQDWKANNYHPVSGSNVGEDNPGRYDAVNIYGDEYTLQSDKTLDAGNMINSPGMGNYYRIGYEETDLVNYDTRNYKANAAFHFRLQPKQEYESPELILSSSFGSGTTIYQGDNRFSLRNIVFFQHNIEWREQEHYFLRAYYTHEDAGDSYDPYFTALRLQSLSKSDEDWINIYDGYWSDSIIPKMYKLGYPMFNPFHTPPFDKAAANQWMLDYQDSLMYWHQLAADTANTGELHNPPGAQDFFEPGTERFQNAFYDITSRLNNEDGGTRFYDHSALFHVHGEYLFKSKYFSEIRTGSNFRMYLPDSKGTIFHDTAGTSIRNSEFGLYAGLKKTLNSAQPVELGATIRVDKNQNFEWIPTYAASMIYQPGKETFLHVSLSSALRNPTLTDQYLYLNVGPAILAGHIEQVDSLITPESFMNVYKGFPDLSKLEYFRIDALRPEFVQTFEVGIRTTFGKKLFLDGSAYVNRYRDFIGYVIGIKSKFQGPPLFFPIDPVVYRYSANSQSIVFTQGASVSLEYEWKDYLSFRGNYTYNQLRKSNEDDPIIPAYNTPKHKFNIGIAGNDMKAIEIGSFNRTGFNINYKWVDGFQYEGSPQYTGKVPAYGVVDAQINIKSERLHTMIKVGASNLLNHRHFELYGGPSIGRQAYVQILYDLHK